MHRIFIVEDDAVIAEAIRQHIGAWGCEARCAKDFEHVLSEFADFDPQLVLMDVSLPFFNGYHWCAEIRRVSKVPIIFISSASDNMNIVMAVNMGGDDFIAKPFDLNVLTAKVQALLRRAYDFTLPAKLLESGGAVLSISDATLTYEGKKTELTKNEFRILQLLFQNKGNIVSRDEIMTRLWESDSFVDENTLTVNITRLRRKLEDIGLYDFISTKKGVGYMVGQRRECAMLLSYLKRHYKIIILFSLFFLIIALVFSLYELEVEAVLYAALLCLFTGIIAFAFGFSKYVRRHRELEELLRNIDVGLYGLPEPKGKVEEDYQALLRALYAQNLSIRSEADSARRDMEDYYTLWAHQIKTPLAAMRLLLAGENAGSNSLMQAELFKTEQYVEMVLQYVRLRSESSDLLIKKCALDEIIKGALRKYARLFALRSLEFSFIETNMTVITDEKWLAFVIEQIFSNSLKYTSVGGISIYPEDGSLVIRDTGIGIRPEDLPRVCEKGYTGASGRADKKSTGIGLFLCKSILTKLGHSLEITSCVGAGTTVKIGLRRDDMAFE